MKSWRWWVVVTLVVVLAVCALVATRYEMQCVSTHPASEAPAPSPSMWQGTQGSTVVCYVLDRWTGSVRKAP